MCSSEVTIVCDLSVRVFVCVFVLLLWVCLQVKTLNALIEFARQPGRVNLFTAEALLFVSLAATSAYATARVCASQLLVTLVAYGACLAALCCCYAPFFSSY